MIARCYLFYEIKLSLTGLNDGRKKSRPLLKDEKNAIKNHHKIVCQPLPRIAKKNLLHSFTLSKYGRGKKTSFTTVKDEGFPLCLVERVPNSAPPIMN